MSDYWKKKESTYCVKTGVLALQGAETKAQGCEPGVEGKVRSLHLERGNPAVLFVDASEAIVKNTGFGQIT